LSDIGSDSDYSLSLENDAGEDNDHGSPDPLITSINAATDGTEGSQITSPGKRDFTEVKVFPTKYGSDKMAASILIEDNKRPPTASEVISEKTAHGRKSTVSGKSILFRWL
jgi:hypothetical protein